MQSAPGGVIPAYVAFGANLGEPVETLRSAAAALGGRPGIELVAGSPVYRTRPIGLAGQPDFANAAARVETTLAADELLDVLLAVEAEFGRVRDVRWGPRTLDLDLIWYEGEERSGARLDAAAPACARARVRAAAARRSRPRPRAAGETGGGLAGGPRPAGGRADRGGAHVDGRGRR